MSQSSPGPNVFLLKEIKTISKALLLARASPTGQLLAVTTGFRTVRVYLRRLPVPRPPGDRAPPNGAAQHTSMPGAASPRAQGARGSPRRAALRGAPGRGARAQPPGRCCRRGLPGARANARPAGRKAPQWRATGRLRVGRGTAELLARPRLGAISSHRAVERPPRAPRRGPAKQQQLIASERPRQRNGRIASLGLFAQPCRSARAASGLFFFPPFFLSFLFLQRKPQLFSCPTLIGLNATIERSAAPSDSTLLL